MSVIGRKGGGQRRPGRPEGSSTLLQTRVNTQKRKAEKVEMGRGGGSLTHRSSAG